LTVAVNINGTLQSIEVDPSTPLLYVLRNDLQLNGAKYGCGLRDLPLSPERVKAALGVT
jgi:nicotinate dehydrogenase subunit A